MAAHVTCHANDYVPNSFPPPRPSSREHGMVSEYEPQIVMHRTIPFRSGVARSKLMDDDEEEDEEYPILRRPVPTATYIPDRMTELSDPLLCITPEKTTKRVPRTARTQRNDDEGGLSRNSQKVRFDDVVKVKHMSPEVDSSLDVDSLNVGGFAADHRLDKPPAVSLYASKKPHSETVDYLASVNKSGTLSTDASSFDSPEILDIEANDDWSVKPDRSLAASFQTRQVADNVIERMLTAQTEPLGILSGSDVENVLERPEFNSLLKVQSEFRQLEESELDVDEAVKQKLETNEKTKMAIEEKAHSKVNTDSVLFPQLASVDVRKEDLAKQKKQQVTKIKPQTKKGRAEDGLPQAPDLMDMFSPDLQRETASFSLEGLAGTEDGPAAIILSRAFDVYQHVRTWEGW